MADPKNELRTEFEKMFENAAFTGISNAQKKLIREQAGAYFSRNLGGASVPATGPMRDATLTAHAARARAHAFPGASGELAAAYRAAVSAPAAMPGPYFGGGTVNQRMPAGISPSRAANAIGGLGGIGFRRSPIGPGFAGFLGGGGPGGAVGGAIFGAMGRRGAGGAAGAGALFGALGGGGAAVFGGYGNPAVPGGGGGGFMPPGGGGGVPPGGGPPGGPPPGGGPNPRRGPYVSPYGVSTAERRDRADRNFRIATGGPVLPGDREQWLDEQHAHDAFRYGISPRMMRAASGVKDIVGGAASGSFSGGFSGGMTGYSALGMGGGSLVAASVLTGVASAAVGQIVGQIKTIFNNVDKALDMDKGIRGLSTGASADDIGAVFDMSRGKPGMNLATYNAFRERGMTMKDALPYLAASNKTGLGPLAAAGEFLRQSDTVELGTMERFARAYRGGANRLLGGPDAAFKKAVSDAQGVPGFRLNPSEFIDTWVGQNDLAIQNNVLAPTSTDYADEIATLSRRFGGNGDRAINLVNQRRALATKMAGSGGLGTGNSLTNLWAMSAFGGLNLGGGGINAQGIEQALDVMERGGVSAQEGLRNLRGMFNTGDDSLDRLLYRQAAASMGFPMGGAVSDLVEGRGGINDLLRGVDDSGVQTPAYGRQGTTSEMRKRAAAEQTDTETAYTAAGASTSAERAAATFRKGLRDLIKGVDMLIPFLDRYSDRHSD